MLEYFQDEMIDVTFVKGEEGAFINGEWNRVFADPVTKQIIAPQPVKANELDNLSQGESVTNYVKTWIDFEVNVREELEDSDRFIINTKVYKAYSMADRTVLGNFRKLILRQDGIDEGPPPPVFINTYSLEFMGTNEAVNLGSAPSVQLYDQFSVFLWIKTDSQPGKTIIGRWNDNALKRSWEIRMELNRFVVSLNDNGQNQAGHRKKWRLDFNIDTETWRFIGFTFDQGELKMYLDGLLMDEVNITKIKDDSITFVFNALGIDVTMGARSSNTGYTSFWRGFMDEPAIYDNRILSEAEVATIYNDGTPIDLLLQPSGADLVFWGRNGDEDVFPEITDRSGEGNDGLMINMLEGNFVTDVPHE